MNEITKVFSSLLLLGAGFVGASLFGPPDLVDQFADQWKPIPQQDPQALRPLESSVPAAPSLLPSEVAKAAPINQSQVEPIRQLAAHDNVHDAIHHNAYPGGQQPQHRATTIWNDQTKVASNRPASDEWLKAIHGGPEHHAPRSSNLSPSLPTAQNAATAATEQSQLTTITSQDVTSPDAWSVPTWEGTNQFASQSSDPMSNSDLGQPSNFDSEEYRGLSGDNSNTNSVDDSFWNRPLAGPQMVEPQKSIANQFANQPAAPSVPWKQNSSEAYAEPNAPRNDFAPSPFGRVEAPAVQRVQVAPGLERTHVVTDGDTLPMLAKRYLGDAGRAQEMYELNRDRLEHPDLLPIGIILRTPEAPAKLSPLQANLTSNSTSQPYKAAYRGEGDYRSSALPTDQFNVGGTNPFSTISGAANRSTQGSYENSNRAANGSGLHRQSSLAPLGQSAELPVAPAPSSHYHSDWSW